MSALRTNPDSTPTTTPVWSPPQDGDWTMADYMRLENPPGFRYELIEGHLLMSPSPNFSHQYCVTTLTSLLHHFVTARGLGVVLAAPFDVVLREDDETAVQPDIMFVAAARESIIQSNHIQGAPDLVVEAISPRREALDRERKFRKYVEAGVSEYWILDPVNRSVEVWVRRGDSLVQLGVHGPGAAASSEVVPGFSVPVQQLFRV